MTMATGNSYGGLEHCNSTSLIIPRTDLPQPNEAEEPSEDYQRFWACAVMSIFIRGWSNLSDQKLLPSIICIRKVIRRCSGFLKALHRITMIWSCSEVASFHRHRI